MVNAGNWGSLFFGSALLISATSCADLPADEVPPEIQELTARSSSSDLAPKLNLAGWARSASSTGGVDRTNNFFQELGTNGRACGTCHLSGEGWTITPFGVTLRFLLTGGTDPIFKPHDAANAPELDVSTAEARWNAYSLLRTRAVIRIGLPVKDTSEFELVTADDPYGHASAAQLSLFRRPLPTTNLRFLSTVNWDGRSTLVADPTNVRQSLKNQSNGATVNHAQAAMPIADDVRTSIVDFETSLTTAQIWTFEANSLASQGALGGPEPLLTQMFAIGMNPPGPTFDPNVFTLFSSWATLPDNRGNADRHRVAAGQDLFNNRSFSAGGFMTTCSGCHSTPNYGGASTFRLFNIGVSAPERRSASVPLYTFRNKNTSETIQTTDPGRALITGLWVDMNKFKVPGLRGLSARAPYFHDGSAARLVDVVNHYDQHFGIGFSSEEKRALVAFLESL